MPSPPRLSTFSAEVQQLADIKDLLRQLIAVHTTAPGKQIKTPPPTPRPQPAAVRLKVQIDRDRHNRLTARLIPPDPPD